MELPKWEEKKIVPIDLWQCCCQNGRKKKCDNWLCFLELPKWEGKKRIMVMELPKIGGERERERELFDKKYIYLEESITSSLPPDSYSPKYLEYILCLFPIKPNLLISHIESMLWILFCLFISLFIIKGRHHH